MISHKLKCIFIHIPKTAGTSINEFFHPGVKFKVTPPDYERLFGWCSKRGIHMQHATSKQLLETELITEEQWKTYFKFTFVRNPWDRAYSDFLWVQRYSGVSGTFKDYINKSGSFEIILNNSKTSNFLGDHLLEQTEFFDFEGFYKPDFIGRFETFNTDINQILNRLSMEEDFNLHKNKTKRLNHYSYFYTGSRRMMVEKTFKNDIKILNYIFEDKKTGLDSLKKYF